MRTLVLLLLTCAAVRAADYHLDSGRGDDANPGTSPDRAWKSLEKASATTFQPGDRLLLKAGSTWTGRLCPMGSGTSKDRIVLDRYGQGQRPVIHGNGAAGGAVRLENQEYCTIRNLEVTNNGSSEPKKMGIFVRNNCVGTLRGIEITDCFVHDVAGDLTNYRDGKESGGIVFVITAANLQKPSQWDDVRIESNTIVDVARNGIMLQSQWINKPKDPNSSWKGHGDYTPSINIRIAGNKLERIGGDGIIPWCVKGAIVDRNVVRAANSNTLKQGHAAIWPYFCEDTIFQFNEVCETKSRFDGMAFDFDNSNQRCVYQYNYSHDNEGGFLNMCCDGNAGGNIARYNISQNDGCTPGSRVFLVHGQGNHDYRIYNNTIYVRNGDPRVFGQGARSDQSSILFQNNLFINAGKGNFKPPQGCRFENNLYFGSGHIAEDAKKILADPRLVDAGGGKVGLESLTGYRLLKGSPALGAGIPIPGGGGRDFWGDAVRDGAPLNVGAYNGGGQ